jgi:hypothetical protein
VLYASAGVLVAVDAQGSSHVLKAFSGQITETWHIPGGLAGLRAAATAAANGSAISRSVGSAAPASLQRAFAMVQMSYARMI